MPSWPGSTPFSAERTLAIADGAEANASALSLDAHAGTHVDAPLHAFAEGAPISALSPALTIGTAFVADTGEAPDITADVLHTAGIPPGTERLLLRTANSRRGLAQKPFTEDYAALTIDGAEWVAEAGVSLIGVDYLSVQRYRDSFATHRALLGGGVWILEGLDLSDVTAGSYELICLPVKIDGVEAAPARAILRAV